MFLCQKWILHCLTVFNIFHLITGCIALSSGIYEFTYSEYHFLRGKYELSLFTGSYITCTCGVFILITSPLGWVGILSQSKSLLTMIHYELEQMFNRLLDNYDEKRLMVNEDTKFFNYLQYKLDCCGKLSVEDLSDRKPILACGLKAGEKKGCLSKLTGLTKSGQFRIALVNYCIAVCQFFGVILCSLFTCSNRNHANNNGNNYNNHHYEQKKKRTSKTALMTL
uniref:Tetraspanin n=1 Tax=Trichobilharzia regenti TaxID=157069 RepID=A0AA85K2H7_TRIRE|nr:unnamed protein product [Trichobilharzia regenti]